MARVSLRLADVEIVEVVGELDVGSSAEFAARLDEAVERGRPLMVDLTDCTFVDVRALRVIQDGYVRAQRTGVRFAVLVPYSGASEVTRIVLELAPVELVSYPVAPDRARGLLTLARRETELGKSLQSERVLALRASLWENGRARERLIRERNLLLLDLRQALADRRHLSRSPRARREDLPGDP